MRDFGEIVKDKGIPWVRHWIDATFEFSKNFVKSGTTEIDFEALGREEWEFRKALKTKDFSKNERAKYLWNEAMNIHNRNANNGKKSPGRPKKSTQDAPNGNAGVDMYDAGNGADSKSPTSCETFTADGDIREDYQDRKSGTSANHYTADASEGDLEVNPDGQQSTQAEAGTSANNYATRQAKNGDAATREGAEATNRRESGDSAPTTVSRNMRQPAKTRDTSESCRYAPPSCSPDDGKHYDQDTSISTDDPQPEGLTGPSHGGSVASLEARQSQRRTGGSSVRGMAKVAQPPVRSGRKFRNKEEFIQWAIDTGLDPDDAGNCWEATMERGGLTKDGKKVDNICAYTVKWCRTSKKNRETA